MLFNKKVISLIIGSLLWLPQFAFSAEVNILSERQEFLLRPFLDVFEENSGSKELYVIASGEVNILINSSAGKKGTVVAILRRGQSFGEVSLVDEGLRSASASAGLKETRLVVIPRDRLLTLCETYPQLGYRLMYNLSADLAMKIRNTDLRIRDQVLYSPPKK